MIRAELNAAGALESAPRRRRESLTSVLYILPGLLPYLFFVMVPIVGTLVLSLMQWDGFGRPQLIGLSNYLRAFGDPLFWLALKHNLLLVPYQVLLPLAIGLVLAFLVTHLGLRGQDAYRMALFLPYVMPGVLLGVIWKWLLNPVFGPVNAFLGLLGLPQPTWLGDFDLALPTVGLIGAWAGYGFCFVVFLAGLQKINPALYEAARIDGSGLWQEFWHIALPSLRVEIFVVLVASMIGALRSFDVIWATTRGGPGRETTVLALHMIQSAFNVNAVGYGAALAVILTLLTMTLAWGINHLGGSGHEELVGAPGPVACGPGGRGPVPDHHPGGV